jgi:asparagine synthetase B (glutamine-hydrolysing)
LFDVCVMKNTEKRKVYPEKRRKVFVGITSKQSFRDATGQGGSGLWTGRGKVFVAMSGGVDSSVAAMLLKNAYLDSHGRVRIAEGRRLEARYSRAYDVVGVFMRCYNVDGCQDRDAEDARRVAEYLSIPFYVWDFEETRGGIHG